MRFSSDSGIKGGRSIGPACRSPRARMPTVPPLTRNTNSEPPTRTTAREATQAARTVGRTSSVEAIVVANCRHSSDINSTGSAPTTSATRKAPPISGAATSSLNKESAVACTIATGQLAAATSAPRLRTSLSATEKGTGVTQWYSRFSTPNSQLPTPNSAISSNPPQSTIPNHQSQTNHESTIQNLQCPSCQGACCASRSVESSVPFWCWRLAAWRGGSCSVRTKPGCESESRPRSAPRSIAWPAACARWQSTRATRQRFAPPSTATPSQSDGFSPTPPQSSHGRRLSTLRSRSTAPTASRWRGPGARPTCRPIACRVRKRGLRRRAPRACV